ncbi:MAG: DEAD/DEAH box helicase [Promethearchaeota archaeon]
MRENTFSLLSESLQQILPKEGFMEATETQQRAIPRILSGENVLLIAPTASGKTEAAIFPVFSKLLESEKDRLGIRILYITPLRALNRDIFKRIIKLGGELGLHIEVRHGDTKPSIRRKQALIPPDMLITTPETLQAILPGKRMQQHLRSVRWVIVDEIHEIVSDKRGVQLSIGLERLRKVTGVDFQRIGLSATVGNPKRVASFLVGDGSPIKIVNLPHSKRLRIEIETVRPKKDDEELAEQLFTNIRSAARVRRIAELVEKFNSVLVFVNTRENAEAISSRLRLLGPMFNFGVHHGSLSREVRVEAEKEFKDEKLKCMVCTSSLELGIDIGAIDFVVQYMSPRQVARLIQRVGRSGHSIGETSRGLVICTGFDDISESLALASRSVSGQLEEVLTHENALDVLCHQIVGIILDNRTIPKEEAFRIIKRAWPFRNLSWNEFLRVINYMRGLGLIWDADDYVKSRRGTHLYYFTHLSMIPDVKRYEVLNTTTGKPVGTLDEEFIVNHGEGTVFIVKGRPWKIISVEEEKVRVEEADNAIGAIPSWEGELIPVPYEVAQDVGRLREVIAKAIDVGRDAYETLLETDIFEKLKVFSEEVPLEDDLSGAIDVIKNQIKSKIGVPTHDQIVIEPVIINDVGWFVIVHSCFGSKVNETIGHILTSLLSARLGASVAVRADPYRITIKLPDIVQIDVFREILVKTRPEHIDEILRIILKGTSLYYWRLLHVAKRFGAIDKDIAFRGIGRRLLGAYEETPIGIEAMREIMVEKLDVRRTKYVFDMIQKGKIKVTSAKKWGKGSPISMPSLKWFKPHGRIGPPRPEAQIIEAVKARLMARQIKLVCLFCGNWESIRTVGTLAENPKCLKCDSGILAVTYRGDSDLPKIVRRWKSGQKLDKEEKKRVKRAQKSASLVLSMGRKAVIALAGHGIGPATVSKILRRTPTLDKKFYKRILEAEKEYARTRVFWDD